MNSGKSILRAIWLFSWLASLHTTSAANQPILNIAQSPHTNPQLQKRQPAPFNSMASLAGGQTGSSSSPQAHSPPRDPPNPLNASCIIKPLELKTWQELSLDDYLRNYPKGNTTSLPAYAASKGLPNFGCGIGQLCSAGQPCYPASLPDWYILFATEQWNIQMNSMKNAIQWGSNYVRSTISSMHGALFPAINTEGIDKFKLDFSVNGAVGMVSNTVILDIFALGYSFQDKVGDVSNIINNVIAAVFELGGGILNAPPPSEGDREAFNEWNHIEHQMQKYEQALVDGLSKKSEEIINSGISSEQGIFGQLRNGTFITPTEAIYLPILEDDMKNVTMVVSLVQVLRSLGAFVTVASDECTGDGKNGAMAGDDVLSYCDTNGTMYNIVRVKNGKYYNQFANAWIISDHYGYSTQFLTNASISCQNKYGGYGHFPYNFTLPRDITSDCMINIPVCDLRNKTIRAHKKRHGLLSACRHAGLPI